MARYGMVIDLDRCTGCGACMVACAVENNTPPTPPQGDKAKGLTWIRVYRADRDQDPAGDGPRAVFVPVPCQQCQKDTPCLSVCPQNAVERDPKTGIVSQIPVRCLGCRYCMAACPYRARSFTWWDPVWPEGLEKSLNPGVAPRMRGIVEKCNFCHARLQSAREKAAVEGRPDIAPGDYLPACAESCPTQAIVFGDLDDPSSEAARLSRGPHAFRLLERLGTEPTVHYLSGRAWVRALGRTVLEGPAEQGGLHG
jgi:molybdopterin-containing oxidoreductase family iron-sulfur binding subunit